MMRTIRPHFWAAAVMVATGCSFSSNSHDPPRAQNDACGILSEKREWAPALSSVERRWGAPAHVVMAIIWKESSFRGDARPPEKRALFGLVSDGHISSAFGYSQALDGTWDWYKQETGNGGADRDDWDDAVDFVGWYMTKTRSSNGLAMTDAFRQYLAYHEGHTGYRRGDWRGKAWLQGAASQVQTQARRYQAQLARCRGRGI